MSYSRLVLILALCTCLLGLRAQKNASNWSSNKVIANAHVGYEFRDVESNKLIEEYQSKKLLNPASTIKLLTSFIFIDKYGADYRYKTSIGIDGKIQRDGTLEGNLIVLGTGDPSFASDRYGSENSIEAILTQIYKAIKTAGISCIEGEIIVDGSAYGTDCTPHTWQYNDLGNYYAAGVWSLNYNENSYELNLNSLSGKKGVKLQKIDPYAKPFYLTSELERGAENSGDQAYIFCGPYQQQAYIRGSIPLGRKTFQVKGSIPDAPTWFAKNLQSYLEQNGIKSLGAKSSYNPQNRGKEIWSHNGIQASEMAQSAIQESINLYCEAFLKSMGDGDRANGIKSEIDYLKQSGIISQSRDIKLSDGSGLSQRNFVTANVLVRFLVKQYEKLGQKEMRPYLARNGYTGTLKNSFKTGGLKGKIYGKSGSMAGVRAYAGFLSTKKGNTLAFSIMVNNYTSRSQDVYAHIEQLLKRIHDEN